MKPKHLLSITLATLLFASFSDRLLAGDESGKLVLNDAVPALVKVTLDLRLRYEFANQEGLYSSNAETLRNRVGLLTRDLNGFQAFAEYEGTLAADLDSYRAASVSGPATRTVIADPESHELNQAWASYHTPDDQWKVKAGRQAVDIDNQRYVGAISWRQNQQTFDMASVT